MKLSISNIAWHAEEDSTVYDLMIKHGFSGLEIAPTRFFEKPYSANKEDIEKIRSEIEARGLEVVAMQSLHYGKSGLSLFECEEQRAAMLEYTKDAVLFAEKIGAKLLVFGSPKLRVSNNIEKDYAIAVEFFDELGSFASSHKCCVCIEPNPKEYNTNFINHTSEALKLVKDVDNDGFGLHIDMGTIIINNEDLDAVDEAMDYIKHIHISSPFLNEINEDDIELHEKLNKILDNKNYSNYVSIEMRRQDKAIEKIDDALKYVSKVFGGKTFERQLGNSKT
ncbi:MAG: sugar phosphate isomerase/epimerase family protein [Eubacteriales bacterium]